MTRTIETGPGGMTASTAPGSGGTFVPQPSAGALALREQVRELLQAEVDKLAPLADTRRAAVLIGESSIRFVEEPGTTGYVIVGPDGQPRMSVQDGRPMPFTLGDLASELRRNYPALFKPDGVDAAPTSAAEKPTRDWLMLGYAELSAPDESKRPAELSAPDTPKGPAELSARNQPKAPAEALHAQSPEASTAPTGVLGSANAPSPIEAVTAAVLPHAGEGPSAEAAGAGRPSAPGTSEIVAILRPHAHDGSTARASLPIPEGLKPVPSGPADRKVAAPQPVPDILPPRFRPSYAIYGAAALLAGTILALVFSGFGSDPPNGSASGQQTSAGTGAPPAAPAPTPAKPPPVSPAPAPGPPAAPAPTAAPAPAPAAAPAPAKPFGTLSGVPEVVDTSTLRIDGRVVRLFGIEWERGAQADDLTRYIAGREVVCTPAVRTDRHRCQIEGRDLSEVVIYNGGGRATAEATPELKAAEAKARAGGVGIWQKPGSQ